MARHTKRILVVDDDDLMRRLLKKLLGRDYQLEEAADGRQALDLLPSFLPHLVMLDIRMPGMDGYRTCRRIRSSPFGRHTQVMMVTAASSREEQVQAYEAGADDYVVKPFDINEMRCRVKLHFRLRAALDAVAAGSEDGELLGSSRREHDATVAAMMAMAEFRDTDTGEHLLRMRSYSQILAEELAVYGPYADQCTPQFLADLNRASPLHDVGKIGISDSILLKPGRLTPEEFESIKQHTVIGANLLKHVAAEAPWVAWLDMAIEVAQYHHERFDGRGYLAGLAGEDIPLSARIVALADAFDAITSYRPYKAPLPPSAAREIIVQDSGSHFDPVVVGAFERCFDTMVEVHEQKYDVSPLLAEAHLLTLGPLLATRG